MRGRSVAFCVVVLLLASGVSRQALAQKSTGDILGTITDPTGGVVRGATVTLTDMATNEMRRATTDDLGNYRFSLLPPGRYSVRAEMAAFRTANVSDLILRVDEQRRQDIVLQVGEVSQSVTVEAEAIVVNAENPAIGNVIESRRLVELPLNGRSFISLAYLSAGTVNPSVGNTESVATGLSGGRPGLVVSVAGMREGSSDILFDGIPSKQNFYSATGTIPPPETIAEFKIQQGYFSPEYGLPAVVNVVTKSGSNEFHGSAWEFLRNDKFDARNAFAVGKGPNRQNQFGIAGGGPIRKNKVFAFASYEHEPIRQSFTGSRAIVPPPAFLNGDFSSLLPGTVIVDPATYDPNTGKSQPSSGTSFLRTALPRSQKPTLKKGWCRRPRP
ncbi:MAG: TonB-dependent receptor [Acidobacteria bacterium]|nr:TonB-dependent receptor [Acidobacteriota bacterium]